MILFCNGKKGFCYDADCSGEKCPYYDGSGGRYVKTNGEQIRAMSDEDLADWLMNMLMVCECCSAFESCNRQPYSTAECTAHVCEWLRQPAEQEPATSYDE